MAPVTTEARAADFNVAHGKIIPAERLPLHVAIHLRIPDEEAEPVEMPVAAFTAEQILPGLKAVEIAVEARRNRTVPLHVRVLAEGSAPCIGHPSVVLKQHLLAAPLMEGAKCRQRQILSERLHNRIGRNLDPVERHDIGNHRRGARCRRRSAGAWDQCKRGRRCRWRRRRTCSSCSLWRGRSCRLRIARIDRRRRVRRGRRRVPHGRYGRGRQLRSRRRSGDFGRLCLRRGIWLKRIRRPGNRPAPRHDRRAEIPIVLSSRRNTTFEQVIFVCAGSNTAVERKCAARGGRAVHGLDDHDPVRTSRRAGTSRIDHVHARASGCGASVYDQLVGSGAVTAKNGIEKNLAAVTHVIAGNRKRVRRAAATIGEIDTT
ncbi:hypothetical protein D3C80_1013330 [compost metagenome]